MKNKLVPVFVALGVVSLVGVFFVGHNSETENIESEVQGYWSPITATVDWCEENYAYSFYIAEFFNTISNFFFIFFSFLGVYCHKDRNTFYNFLFIHIFNIGIQWSQDLK